MRRKTLQNVSLSCPVGTLLLHNVENSGLLYRELNTCGIIRLNMLNN